MKGRTLRTAVALLAMALVPALAWSADSRVKGKVMTAAGEGIEGAEIELNDASKGKVIRFKSKKDGSFYQRGLVTSTYTLTVKHEGYTPHIIEEVRVQAGAERNFDITLRSIAERQQELRKAQGLEEYGAAAEAFPQGDFATAVAKADEAIAKHPEDVKGYDAKAKALIRMKRYDEALPLLEKVLSMPGAPADTAEILAGATYNAGSVAQKADDVDKAIELFNLALERGYQDRTLEGVIGRLYLSKPDMAAAEKHLSRYLEQNPQASDAAEVKALLAEIQKLEAHK